MPIIELKNINKRFERKKGRIEFLLHPFKKEYKAVLKDINIVIDKNGIYSLVGPNGSGKTTLLRIISGILYPDSGEILIDKNHFTLNPHKVFLISESDKGFFPRLTLKNNLFFFASLVSSDRKKIKEKIDNLMEEFDLDKERDTHFQELSTGTRQRLAIARAMLFNPDILLFDEITKGIDIKQQQTIYNLIRRLKELNKTIVFATHLIGEIENLSDYVILIENGKILDFGSYNDIRKNLNMVFDIQ